MSINSNTIYPINASNNNNTNPNTNPNTNSNNSLYFDAVVQIFSFVPEINPLIPFQTEGTKRGRGSGFFIAPNIIMTAAHVVNRAYPSSGVKFSVPHIGKDKQFDVRVLTFIPEIDVALLLVTSPDFPPREKYFLFGDDRKLIPGNSLNVVGYPMGDKNIKLTKSTFNGLQDGVIQLDSSINPGNSGGPVLFEEKVVGIISAGYNPQIANSVVFAIPISVFLSTQPANPMDIQKNNETKIIRLPSLGIMYNNSTEADGLVSGPLCATGINVQWVAKESALYNKIYPGDKICTIIVNQDEFKIDNVGEVQVHWYASKIPLVHMISLIPINNPIKIKFWDHKTLQIKEISVTLKYAFSGCYDPIYVPFEKNDYEPFGGVIVMPLKPIHLMFYDFLFYKLKPTEKEKNQLIISYILPNSIVAQADILHGGDLIKSVNGKSVSTLEEYRDALKSPLVTSSSPCIEWITVDDIKGNFQLEKLLAEETNLRNSYNFKDDKVYYNVNNNNIKNGINTSSNNNTSTSTSSNNNNTS